MTEVMDRLRRLRQDAGIAARENGTTAAMPPDTDEAGSGGVIEQLRRLRRVTDAARPTRRAASGTRLISTGLDARPELIASVPFFSVDRDVPGEEIAAGLRYTEEHVPWDDAPAVVDAGFAKLGPIQRERLLFFDTETTGLAGGTGTRAFMIGAADWRDGRLRLRQLTITTMAAEAAMLRTFAGWLPPGTVLVSYNGKCYDAPLLNTRYRLARQPSPLTGLPHLDLLHPARRQWKGRWENCRLGTLERRVLDIVRNDDLPGSEAPRAWRDYLRGGSARDLRRVAEHNAQDLRSLAGLCLHLATLQEAQPKRPVM